MRHGLVVLVLLVPLLVAGASTGLEAQEDARFSLGGVVDNGYEEVLVGRTGDHPGGSLLTMNENDHVVEYDLSDDGSTAWVIVRDFATGADRVFVLDLNGTVPARQVPYDIVANEKEITTSNNGDVAWISAAIANRDGGPFPPREYLFHRASRDGSFVPVYDTHDIDLDSGDSDLENFDLTDINLQTTSVGGDIYWETAENVWTINTTGQVAKVHERDDQVIIGQEVTSGFSAMAINDSGGTLLTSLQVRAEGSNDLVSNAVIQPSVAAVDVLRISEEGRNGDPVLSLSNAGDVLGLCNGGTAEDNRPCLVGERDELELIDNPYGLMDSVHVTGGGQVVYGQAGNAFAERTVADFVTTVEAPDLRRTAQTGLLAPRNAQRVDGNDRGDLFTFDADVNTGPGTTIGLAMARPGLQPPGDLTRLSTPAWRVDSDTGQMSLQVRLTPGTVAAGQVIAEPLIDSWINHDEVLGNTAANPFTQRTYTLTPSEQDPELYETTFSLRGGDIGDVLERGYTIRFMTESTDGAHVTWQEMALNDAGGSPPTPGPGPAVLFDGDPATTERLSLADPVAAAVAISDARFSDQDGFAGDGRLATYGVLSRDDVFADSLAGAALAKDGPLLLTDPLALSPESRAELTSKLAAGATVYLLGGVNALSQAIEDELVALGFTPARLSGPSRIETAVRVAQEVRAINSGDDRVMIARAFGPQNNPTAAWADSVTGGAYSAYSGIPILVTQTEGVHPAVADFLTADGPSETILLGGTAALSPAVEAGVPSPKRIAGPSRDATAVAILEELWAEDLPETSTRRFVVLNGFSESGWQFGLPAAGVSADQGAPMLVVNNDVAPGTTVEAVTSTTAEPEVDLLILGDNSIVPAAVQAALDSADGG